MKGAIATGMLLLTAAASAAEIGYVEDFALAQDRTEALRLLIPGSEDHYYYHCLHYQNTEQFDKVEELLAAWIKRYDYTPRVREIQNRQALLTYERNPQQSLEFIRQQLGLEFNHKREILGEKPNLPTELDQQLISRERLTQIAKERYQNLSGFEESALDWLIGTELDPERRRNLLQRLQRPDYPNLAQLVVDDLNYRNSQPFGSMPIHGQLLLAQLDECVRLKPDLLNQQNFVNAYLTKLQPSDDVDWLSEPKEHEAYLDRLWSFVSRLEPVHNSLKAHVLYHRLVFDRARGVYDKERFMTYLRLPRQVLYIAPRFLELGENRRFAADLNADFEAFTLLPPVRNDEPLVRSYLHHFFVQETSTAPYAPYISDVYLRHNLAEAKIVNGLGEPEQWYSLLPPDQYQALKDRIDLDFAFTNQHFFAASDPVSLEVHVKNVRSLIVRVFRINTRNFYREHQREVNTDINLDGLVANDEQTFEYAEPPLRRVRRRFDFPALAEPGVYVIDFIGNGMNSRVVIRKGQLRHLVRSTPVGQLFTVLDEKNNKVSDATIWLAGHEYPPNANGEILVPFSTNPGRQAIILSRGSFSSLAFFDHQGENYALAAGIYVDRESLLRRTQSAVVVRPGLTVNGTPITLTALEDVRLTIASVDLDGVSSRKEVPDFRLFEDRESVYEFQTPPRLSQITFTLQAKVQSHSQNQKIDLTASQTFQLNEIDKTEKIEDLHFAEVNGLHVLELRGKSGEAMPDRPIQLAVKHRDFTEPVHVTLQTNEAGRVRLGALRDIQLVTATGPEGTARTYVPQRDQHSYSRLVHGAVGQPIELPYMGEHDQPLRSELSLLALRGESFVLDRFDALSMRDGLLVLSGLERGDYDLLFKQSGERQRIRVANGAEAQRYVLGPTRQLEVRNSKPLQIGSLSVDDNQVQVQLTNSSPFARVHVFATRFVPAFPSFPQFARVVDAEPFAVRLGRMTSLYVAGRSIGDEYQYIINRRYAKKFPGVMAERPNLLLNPWAIRTTEATQQQAEAGADFAPQAEPPASMAYDVPTEGAAAAHPADFSNLDFLADASLVLVNLKPDEAGVLSIPIEKLGAHQHLHVVAIDPRNTVVRSLSRAEKPMGVDDLRLLAGLDPQKHYTQQKRISVVKPGDNFVLPDITTSRFETYDTLARVYSLYATLTGDAKLAEFAFVQNWPNLPSEEQHTLYSKYACHELNFYLAHQDPRFFETVIQPYLANKKDKTFLDHWLLGHDLSAYLQPWSYARLNIAERILLSERIAADRPHTRRDVQDQLSLLPPDLDRGNLLFLTAVKGRALDTEDKAIFLGAQMKAIEDQRLMLGRFAGAGGAEAKAAAPAPMASGLAANGRSDPGWMAEQAESEEFRKEAGVEAIRARGLRRSLAAGMGFGVESRNGAVMNHFYTDQLALGDNLRRLYEKLDKTQEWVENNYYKLPIEEQFAQLVTVNAFWRDYADHDAAQPFLSTNLAEASRNFTEMMLALSLLDLPFAAGEHKTEFAGSQMTLTAASPMVVYHEEIREAGSLVEQTPILVSQNFFRHGDRYRFEGNQQLDKFVTDEFLVHTVYGCQVVITNPTSSPQRLDVLLQIPFGSIPVLNAQETRSVHLELGPYNTQTIEYHFYFPAAGKFPHYPVHVSKNEKLLAFAEPVELTVVEQLSRVDRDSWPYISQNGSAEDVLNYLSEHNLHRTDLDKIAFRMGHKEFFLKVVELLSQRHSYNHTLWSYGIKHNDVPAIREYLQHADDFVQQCGAYLNSPLVTIEPVVRHTYQQMEYSPLVNARAHQLGRRRQILNNRFYEQYHRLLTILSYRRELTPDDRLAVTYYLLLQDRVEEALAFFDTLSASDVATQMQYDYFAAYLSLARADVANTRRITERYAAYPVERWRIAFAALDRQLDEIDSGEVEVLDPESRSQTQAQLASTEPSFDIRVEGKQLHLDYQNVGRVLVNYYLMDIELLFSRNPFVQEYSTQFSQIYPNLTETFELAEGKGQFTAPLPEELHNRNVLVEVVGAGQTKSQPYFSNSMSLQVIENYGQLRVASANPGEPLPKVYVKVYARMQDGTVQFFKDGYTDLRGRFDYSSLNTNELDFVQRFALLVLSDERGAVVREASPPAR